MLKYIFSVKLDHVNSSLRGERERGVTQTCMFSDEIGKKSLQLSSWLCGLDMRALARCFSAGPACSFLGATAPAPGSLWTCPGRFGILSALCACLPYRNHHVTLQLLVLFVFKLKIPWDSNLCISYRAQNLTEFSKEALPGGGEEPIKSVGTEHVQEEGWGVVSDAVCILCV